MASRTDEILSAWESVAHAAPRPAEAPRPGPSSPVSIGLLSSVAIVVVVVAGLALRGGTLSPSPDVGGAACGGDGVPGTRLVAVVQSQMDPTLVPGDTVAVTPASLAELRRGDIIAFDWSAWNPGAGAPPTVMRVIGLPGDVIELRGGYVYVNGSALAEPYLRTPGVTVPEPALPSMSTRPASWSVPNGTAFVLGDSRMNAADSRAYGPLPASAILGKVASRCPSVTPIRLALPTMPTDSGACRGIGLDAVLTGDRADPRVAWLVAPDGSGRRDLIWPPGYTARFAPSLEILDASGAVVFRAGDHVDGACVESADLKIVHIIPKATGSPPSG